jgi:serine/threonine-protein kinase
MSEPSPPTVATPSSLRALFDLAIEQPPEERAAWIDAHVPDPALRVKLLRLIDAAGASGVLDVPAAERAAAIGEAPPFTPAAWVGRRIGAFRLVRPIGEGGMAIVFLGERDDPALRQQVAVKLMRCGLPSDIEQRLFQRERQALAALSHPHIARFIDGGVAEGGVPYIVMEYVDGRPIDRHAADARLDLRARVAAMVDACRAVAAAHRALIVHRDLKPSNILVDGEGRVKLLDFGIAKLLDGTGSAPQTEFVAMTPAYAAPEQREAGAISTATDVYALGVVLHELLLGERPRPGITQRPSTRIDRDALVAAGLPANPPVVAGALAGDLDNILAKALAPDPARRYPDAAALADDLERHLEGRPVLAHPPSRWYTVRKFVQRHRGGVAVTCALVLAVFASLGVALWQAREAQQQAQRANAVRDFVLSVFESARARLPRDLRPTPEQLVAQAQARLDAAADLDPALRVDLDRTLGEVLLSLSAHAEADAALARAQEQTDRTRDPAAWLALEVQRAHAWFGQGELARVATAMDRALPDIRRVATPLLPQALAVLARARLESGEIAAALAHQREATRIAEAAGPQDSEDVLVAGFALGGLLAAAQEHREAHDVLAPRLATWRDRHDATDARYVQALGALAVADDALGDLASAEARLREVLDLQRRIYPAQHDAVANALRNLGSVVGRRGDAEAAAAHYDEALAMQREVLDPDSVEIAITEDALGVLRGGQRRFEEAVAHYQRSLAICARGALRNEVCPRARNNLGMAYYRMGKHADARREMEAALAERRALFGDDHPTVAYSMSTLSNVSAASGDDAGARDLAAQAVALLERRGLGDTRDAALVRQGLAMAQRRSGDPAAGLAQVETALATWRRVAPQAKAREVSMLIERAQSQRDLGDRVAVAATLAEIEALAVPAAELAPVVPGILVELADWVEKQGGGD